MRIFLSFGFQKNCQNDDIKNNETGESCSCTSGGDSKCFVPQLQNVRRERSLERILEGNETKNMNNQLAQDAAIWWQCAESNEHLISLLDRELIELDSDCQFFKQDFTASSWVQKCLRLVTSITLQQIQDLLF